ncbi:MAG TPA: hypothetical protein VER14_08385 [Phototrophicaceae bacterium]|nr:hypothetical protein [Phototrophicaceae bacterium]
MIRWIKTASSGLAHQYMNILLFNTLTGLRPNDVQKSLDIVKTKETQYVDKERMMLKHYQFPSLFIRQTNNACMSITNQDIFKIAKDTPYRENYYNSLRKRISITNKLDMNMYYCRKVFAILLGPAALNQRY